MPTADGYRDVPCNIIIVGASGDLARRKLMPALFSLFCNDMLPKRFAIFGFARTGMTDEAFREHMTQYLTCRYTPGESNCQQLMDEFLARSFYHQGQYDSTDDFHALAARMLEEQPEGGSNLVYMAIPPSVFLATANSVAEAGLMKVATDGAFARVVLEKPFGRDTASAEELQTSLASLIEERQTYRIDHYLGKEVIQNLMILRFANLIFEPVWNLHHIEEVHVSWSEKLGTGGRAGYFDHYGIIRDVIQNHLLQITALIGMEHPISLDAEAIRDEKVKLLRSITPVRLGDLVIGQYTAGAVAGKEEPGYLDDPEVPKDSICPTYARAVLRINNPRWYGVPFILTAGKALHETKNEILIRFRSLPYSVFRGTERLVPNSLRIRVQPNEAIELTVNNKVPGLAFDLEPATLNLHYQSAFSEVVPDAYERLLLDVLRGDRSLFLRDDEVMASWQVVTPVLEELEKQRIKPTPYAFGSEGPGFQE